VICKLVKLLRAFYKTTEKLSHRNSCASEILLQIRYLEMHLSNAKDGHEFTRIGTTFDMHEASRSPKDVQNTKTI
jgi:hypothetical protein